MSYLYLLLDIAALAGPMLLSFDKKVNYVSNWKNVFLACLIIAIPFLIWDLLFTVNGVWGFNDAYLTRIRILHLPIEEVLFFFIVPFACTFIYECLKYYLRNIDTKKFDQLVAILLISYMIFLLYMNPTGWYTITALLSGFFVLIWWWRTPALKNIGLTFILSLIPFLLMNGILTGSFIEAPIVFYNDLENSGVRIFTIPMEDVIYGMALIIAVILTFEKLNSKRRG